MAIAVYESIQLMRVKPLTPQEQHLLNVTQCAIEDIWGAAGGQLPFVISALGSMIETTLNGIEDEVTRERIVIAFLRRLGEGLGMRVETLHPVEN